MRLFVGIELPDDVRDGICKSRLAAVPVRPIPDRWLVPPENIHVTVKFLGEVAESQVPALCARLEECTGAIPLKLAAHRVECLPERGPIRIIAAGVAGELDRLQQLHRTIDSACDASGFPRERRPFKPHITFARLRPPRPTQERRQIESTPLQPNATRVFEVTNFALFQSHLDPQGARYVLLARFPG
jgi:RNA 2',3'-cyclic 3'-phosphodiesterase